MYCLELIKCDISNTSYYVEVECRKWCSVARSWKMILGGHGKVMEKFSGKVWESCIYCAKQCCFSSRFVVCDYE